MTYRIAITAPARRLDPARRVFEGLDVELLDVPGGESFDPEALVDVHAAIVGYDPIDADLLERLSDCRIVARGGIGYDNIDVDAATERGVLVTNVPDYCIPEVSDHAMALVLALERNVVTYDDQVRVGGWDTYDARTMHRLSTRTLGLVAFGDIARAVGEKAAAFGMDVLAHDPYLGPDEIRAGGAEPVDDLHAMLERSDVVSVHAPLTDETRGLLDRAAFERMPDHGIVVNTSRGPVIDEDALVAALERGEIDAAGLDVFEAEPPAPDGPLCGRDDVILTPHAAWNSVESEAERLETAARHVRTALEGGVPETLVNPAALE